MNKKILEEQLRISMGIDRIAKNADFKEFLLPYLEKLSYVKPINPIKKEEDYSNELRIANTTAYIYSELVRFITTQENVIDKIRKQLEQPEKKYGV